MNVLWVNPLYKSKDGVFKYSKLRLKQILV